MDWISSNPFGSLQTLPLKSWILIGGCVLLFFSIPLSLQKARINPLPDSQDPIFHLVICSHKKEENTSKTNKQTKKGDMWERM